MPQLPGSFAELVVSEPDIQATPLLMSHAVLFKSQPPQTPRAEEAHLLQNMNSTPLKTARGILIQAFMWLDKLHSIKAVFSSVSRKEGRAAKGGGGEERGGGA